ncbi:hypothetical protein LUZ60_017328 [Juncus effusus]|nr:hypothetical protein LUZ60_017328 [Juncus effusus]
MGVKDVNISHVKSHLQMYRSMSNHPSLQKYMSTKANNNSKQDKCMDIFFVSRNQRDSSQTYLDRPYQMPSMEGNLKTFISKNKNLDHLTDKCVPARDAKLSDTNDIQDLQQRSLDSKLALSPSFALLRETQHEEATEIKSRTEFDIKKQTRLVSFQLSLLFLRRAGLKSAVREMSVLLVTSVGDIVVDLHTDHCPLTTKNFLKLCKIKYYNGCLFHKVERDFLAQTGDPTGTGTGGDSVYKFLYGDQARVFEDEIKPDLKHTKIGTVSMASGGKNCNASQFYFTLREDLDYLDEKHTVFGIVEEQEGLDTLTKINESFVDDKGRPLKDIRIKHTYILDDPFDDPPQLSALIPENSPEGKPRDEIAEERLEDNWVPLDEKMKPEELEELIRAKEAHTNAAILEIIGDIPDADMKPPENVLFVCKLNPVTQDEDLYTIFSRFGPVTSAEIIRDYKTGDSLCYAFIEFEDKESCERAYFKMDNVLIDDRRIHVDFSQSVAKLWGQFRRGKNNQANNKDGCFKCGAKDHFARDCGDEKVEKPKYVLKEGNIQHGGGDDRNRYDMVFDEDNVDKSEREEKTKKRKVDEPRREHRDDYKSRHEDRDYDRRHRSRRDERDEREGKSRGGERERYKRDDEERDGKNSKGGERERSKRYGEEREGKSGGAERERSKREDDREGKRSVERERYKRDGDEREGKSSRGGERERYKRGDEERERQRGRDYDERERRERRRG